jgi:hypothetical protein
MITPHLEKLILSGNASYNTFVIGGSEKSILNVAKNRFVIITDITYFHQLNLPFDPLDPGDPGSALNQIFNNTSLVDFLTNRLNTQLRVFSRKSNNLFIYRNNINVTSIGGAGPHDDNFLITTNGQTHLNTFLIHEDDISFSFSKVGENTTIVTGVSPAESIGNAPPFDYGLQGQTGALFVREKTRFTDSIVMQNVPAGNKYKAVPNAFSYEFQNEVNPATIIDNVENASAYPLLLVGYVEVNGTPTNIGATL